MSGKIKQKTKNKNSLEKIKVSSIRWNQARDIVHHISSVYVAITVIPLATGFHRGRKDKTTQSWTLSKIRETVFQSRTPNVSILLLKFLLLLYIFIMHGIVLHKGIFIQMYIEHTLLHIPVLSPYSSLPPLLSLPLPIDSLPVTMHTWFYIPIWYLGATYERKFTSVFLRLA